MILYSSATAPNARRATIFAAEKGAEFEIRNIDIAAGEQLSDSFRAINPRATVPTLVTDSGTVICENIAIASYLEEMYPEPPLMGRTAEDRAMVLMWNALVEFHGLMPIGEAFRNSHPSMEDRAVTGPRNFAQIPDLAERGRARAEDFIDMLESRLMDVPYLAGDFFSLADITAFVSVSFGRVIKLRVPDDKTAVQRWMKAIAARPSVAG